MRKFAIYGKGGIGKSTTAANVSAALAMMGKQVVQVGCDPKADSTLNLLHGEPVMPVMDYYRKYTKGPDFEHIGKRGFGGVFCIETGGPTPGLGCAGRGIIATFDLMDEMEVFQKVNPDVVLYDVLGDVVCGGFSAPIRDGYADEIFIVTSGEKMALYAAGNIIKAVENFKDRGYAQVKGIILNRRNVDAEYELVKAFADEHQLPIVADIPRSKDIQYYENKGLTVVEGNPDLPVSRIYRDLAASLLQA
ncbi:nitrogenase iron protein NifH [Megasphaera sp.]|uniref:nitrogenase iron protein NifH n=1 Tax=Megasphaera sp. TaxID=2023260 RepID=UPI0025DDF259|nr:nitrogenase iron protein NifH [uncultured Megasphaera sp.]